MTQNSQPQKEAGFTLLEVVVVVACVVILAALVWILKG